MLGGRTPLVVNLAMLSLCVVDDVEESAEEDQVQTGGK